LPRFISQAIEPQAGSFDPSAIGRGEPSLPSAFVWGTQTLVVASQLKSWRTTKVDRGDTYVDKHWFDFLTPDGATATVYFHRRALRGQARWWLHTIEP